MAKSESARLILVPVPCTMRHKQSSFKLRGRLRPSSAVLVQANAFPYGIQAVFLLYGAGRPVRSRVLCRCEARRGVAGGHERGTGLWVVGLTRKLHPASLVVCLGAEANLGSGYDRNRAGRVVVSIAGWHPTRRLEGRGRPKPLEPTFGKRGTTRRIG